MEELKHRNLSLGPYSTPVGSILQHCTHVSEAVLYSHIYGPVIYVIYIVPVCIVCVCVWVYASFFSMATILGLLLVMGWEGGLGRL